jgi:hypothetical protein
MSDAVPNMPDPRRKQPIEIIWRSAKAVDLYIDETRWSEVEWSEKRRAWCIQDAEGHCLRHHASIVAECCRDKAEAVALAETMIRDGSMPSPEAAKAAYRDRRRDERERRDKLPAQIARKQRRAEEERLRHIYFDLWSVERSADKETPLYELILDAFDLNDPDLWKRNSFARLRDRLVLSLQRDIAEIKYDLAQKRRRGGKKRFAQHVRGAEFATQAARLQRAEKLLLLAVQAGATPIDPDDHKRCRASGQVSNILS